MKTWSLVLLLIPFFQTLGFSQDPVKKNRLASESSPYLLQHARNPVDWYPWGDEALAKAKKEEKLIFLSIGYAACHWCHVMEKESFEDREIAEFLNRHFVCIKVDREERPDIDQIYMTAVQIMTGRGGWPLSAFLTPDAKPIFGGTYFPARTGDRGNAPGFLSVLGRAHDLWQSERQGLKDQAERVTEGVRSALKMKRTNIVRQSLDRELLRKSIDQTFEELSDQFDPQFGGFGFSESNPNRPKFPEPSNLLFLLELSLDPTSPKPQSDRAKSMLIKTLDSMECGGIFDHLGGGFHRYSVDRKWEIPHFEKMLYDNAQLPKAYARAFEVFSNEEYRNIAEATCDFVLRELRGPEGAFYSSLDADSEGEEGKYYRWDKSDIQACEKKIRHFDLFAEVYGFRGEANFESYYVPRPGSPLSSIANLRQMPWKDLDLRLKQAKSDLLSIRETRIRPATDTKILASWNGLMIEGLADVGRILKRQDYIESAIAAANFVLKQMKTKEGRIVRSYSEKDPKQGGYLDDYAFLIAGLISLHRATSDDRWLSEAIALVDDQLKYFQEAETGGFFYTASDHPELLVRFHDPTDGVLPSGNSVTALNLDYLCHQGHQKRFQKPLEDLLSHSIELVQQQPRSSTLMSLQFLRWSARSQELP